MGRALYGGPLNSVARRNDVHAEADLLRLACQGGRPFCQSGVEPILDENGANAHDSTGRERQRVELLEIAQGGVSLTRVQRGDDWVGRDANRLHFEASILRTLTSARD